jgi:hypothetical protein
MQNIQYAGTVLKRLFKKDFCNKPRGNVWIKSTQIRWLSGQSDGRLDLVRGSQRLSKLSYLKGSHHAQIHSDQMVLVMARGEAGPRERWTKTLKGELENNSRKPRDLVGKKHSDSLKRVNLLFLRLDEEGR